MPNTPSKIDIADVLAARFSMPELQVLIFRLGENADDIDPNPASKAKFTMKIAEHFARIKLLREAQDYDDALNLVDQVLLIDPNDDEALRLRDTLRDEARDRTVATEPRKGTP